MIIFLLSFAFLYIVFIEPQVSNHRVDDIVNAVNSAS